MRKMFGRMLSDPGQNDYQPQPTVEFRNSGKKES